MLAAGNPFPNFSLPNQEGKTTRLSDFAGQCLVVYFYPKDDTPGCTTQGKSFTATKAEFDAAGIKVVGVSADDVTSHRNFSHKFAFTIDLLSDTRLHAHEDARHRTGGMEGGEVLGAHHLRSRSQGRDSQGIRKGEPGRTRESAAHRHRGDEGEGRMSDRPRRLKRLLKN